LVKGTEWEDELPVQKRTLYTANHASRYSAKTGVALYHITTKFDGDVVQSRAIRMPELWIGYSEDKRSTADSRSSAFDVLGMWLVDRYFDRAAGISTTVYSNVDCRSLAIVAM
jgi:hypothetical protein